MKIEAIQANKLTFTSVRKIEPKSFVTSDSFVKSDFDFDTEAKIFYEKMQKSMGVVTPKDIVIKANKVSRRTGVKLDEVYETMGLLSQYSSYKSLSVIEKELIKNDIRFINNLKSYYKKHNCEVPVCLTSVLYYISLKNMEDILNSCVNKDEQKALFIDSKLIDIAKNDYEFKNDKNSKLFYIENFENGYNFFNQSKDFEDFTEDVLKKAKELQSKNGKSIKYNVQYILNGKNYKNIKTLWNGENIEIIKQNNVCTPEKIADNLNPIIPDYETFKMVLDNISKKHVVSKTQGEKYVINSLNEMFEAVTPFQLSKYLQELHEEIAKHLEEQGRDINKVYYIIPNIGKSFALINYQYQKANNIDNMKNYVMNCNSIDSQGLDINSLPENSTIVLLDDYMLLGHSMMNEHFPYQKILSSDKALDIVDNKNIQMVFAPVFSIENGFKNVNNEICQGKRGNKDFVVTANIIKEPSIDGKDMSIIRSNKFLTSNVMPYMGPDSNAEEFIPLYEKFLYYEDAQKTPMSEYGFYDF